MAGIYRLKGSIKHYDWGGKNFIPGLLKEENTAMRPFAEYWMGVHHSGHAKIETAPDEWKDLKEYVHELPYLLKILDVNSMLSIQVHPSKQVAEKEFARENAAGIPLDSPQRNYKDSNHKPELIVALSDFWLLHGFKPPEELSYTLLNVVELRELLQVYNQSGYEGLYKHVMEMPQEEVNRILQPLIDNLDTIYKNDPPGKEDEDHWVAKASALYTKDGNIDRGIFSIYLFNLVHLKKGEGMFQDAGVPHAYLEGQCVEIMANSDNVLRGGLTNKYIDVVELLKNARCEANYPQILEGEEVSHGKKIYRTSAPDFQLSVVELKKDETNTFSVETPEIILLTDGIVELNDRDTKLELKPGMPSAIILPGSNPSMKALADSVVYRASVGVNKD